MKYSEWDIELSSMTDEALETAYVSMSKLLAWDIFKDNFPGISTLKSLIACEQMDRRFTKKKLSGGTDL